MTTDEFAMYDAAYMLGALAPADRREFEDHLKVCSACASSVGELAGLPGLMSRVAADQLSGEVAPLPETLLPSLARLVRGERKRRRLAVGAAAAVAACLITVGSVAITRPDDPPQAVPPSASSLPGTNALAMTAIVPVPVTASARLVDMAWGTRIDVTCSSRTKGAPQAGGTPYTLVVIDRDGRSEQVASWASLPNRDLSVMGASWRDRQDIATVEVRTLKGRAILRLSVKSALIRES